MSTQPTNLEPKTFSEIFVTHEFRPINAVARQLRDARLQEKVLRCLKGLGQRQFIDLTAAYGIAEISIALYAGDGVITKMTPKRFMAIHNFPFVVPPFHSETIDDGVVIANYPYVSTKGVNAKDIDYMRSILAEQGLRFRRGDDRPDNVGRLPDGTLAVVDGNALEMIPGKTNSQKLEHASEEWLERIRDIYPELYAPGYRFRQSEETDFTLRSAHKIEEETPQSPQQPPQNNHRSWLSRRLHRDTTNDPNNRITRQ